MQVISILDNIEYNPQRPQLSILLDTPSNKEVRIVFKEGQIMKEHKASHPIVVHVVSGIIDFGVGEERFRLTEGMMISLDRQVLHELKAEQDSIVRLSINKAG